MCQINKFGAILPAVVHMATTTKIAANGQVRRTLTSVCVCVTVQRGTTRLCRRHRPLTVDTSQGKAATTG